MYQSSDLPQLLKLPIGMFEAHLTLNKFPRTNLKYDRNTFLINGPFQLKQLFVFHGKKWARLIVFLNFGALLSEAKVVADKLDLTLIDMRFVKPLDEEILLKYLCDADMFISLEDGSIMGGAGSAVQEFCSQKNIKIRSRLFGIPDVFIDHASREEMIEDAGINATQILDSLNL